MAVDALVHTHTHTHQLTAAIPSLTWFARFALELLLLCVLLGDAAGLELPQLLFLLLPRLLLLLALHRLLFLEVIVVTLVDDQLLLVKMNDLLAYGVEEILIVRHNQKRLLPLLQVVVQPNHCVEI